MRIKQVTLGMVLCLLIAHSVGCAAPPEVQVRGPGVIFFYTDG